MTFLLSLGLFYVILGVVLVFIILLALVENELGFIAGLFLLAVGFGAYFSGDSQIFKSALHQLATNPVKVFGGIFLYIVAGTIYSFWRWYLLVKRNKTKGYSLPKAEDYKSDLGRWIVYWVVSIWWILLNEPIKALVNTLVSTYDRLAANIYT